MLTPSRIWFKFIPGRPGTLAADFFREEYNVDYTLAKLNEERIKGAASSTATPLQISVWDGIVMGGGVGISAHGAYRIATERTLVSGRVLSSEMLLCVSTLISPPLCTS